MYVLHAHWEPPENPTQKAGLLFWAETSYGQNPAWKRGRLAKNPRPKPHPFTAPGGLLGPILDVKGVEENALLDLPTTRSGPLPSPMLPHEWDLDLDTQPFLAPWIVRGIWVPAEGAIQALLSLPERQALDDRERPYLVGDDLHFWRQAANLALETLAAQKLVPVLAQADPEGGVFHARWLPILDGPNDGLRLSQLESACPPVCLSATVNRGREVSPQALISAFLNTTCDALARTWGKPGLRGSHLEDHPAHRWMEALFSEDPSVQATPAQLQAMAASQRAWLRNLDAAGSASFRVAFRLEAPQQQIDAGATGEQKPEWKLHYLLQVRDDPSLLVPAREVWKTRGNALKHLNRRFEQPQEKLLAGLGYAARLFEPFGESLKSRRPTLLSLDSQAAYTFLREVAPVLEGAGFGVLVPPWWNKPGARLGVRLRMRPAGQQKAEKPARSGMSLEKLVDYQWELSLGETLLSEEEFFSLAALKSPLVQIRGQWVQLDPEQIEAAIRFWEKQGASGQMSLLEAVRQGLDSEVHGNGLPVDDVVAEGWLNEWLARFKQSQKLVELPQPQGLVGELRPYQRYGFSWLSFHRDWGLGACLADDMGLGKTIQTLALILKEKDEQGSLPAPALLVCPTSVVTNWEREIRKFAPSVTALTHQGTSRLRGEDFVQASRSVDLVLTSYPLARQDSEMLQSVNWLGVILDEAQNIKNPSARQTQAIRKLRANFRLALTGTPVENRLAELWSIMHFLNPGYLGSREKFRSDFALPIERYNDQETLDRLKQLVSPFILRRVKTDPTVIQDLPEKVETKVYCHLSEEQATLYQAVVQDAMERIDEGEGMQRRGQVLSMLMQLKQICNHPVQYLHQVEQDRRQAAGPVGPDAKAVVERSGKLARLVELLEEILAEGDRLLIFTQFAEMGQILAHYLPQITGSAVQFLHGGTPAKARDVMVKRFQEDGLGPPIFILSLKAGGTGLNLTRANHVFHFDRWWNPAVEDQATDRAFRIGQKRNVQVHKFVTVGTMEEMIDDMIESKKGLAQAVIGRGEHWLTELSTGELRNLVQLRSV
jgi:SNF2 family DNA or RNA helicase